MVGFLTGLDATPPPAVSYSSTDLENPPSRATVAAEQRQRKKKCWTILGISIMALAMLGGMIFLILWIDAMTPPHYSVAIESVSGLDPTTDLRLPVLAPAFNLTFRVASVSRQYKACVKPGTYVEVAYRCITLAASGTAQQRLCAGPREAADQQLVARGTGVRVPGAVLDSLAADMRQGAVVFQVTVRQSGGNYADDMLVALCGGRRVGAATDDLGTRCDARHFCPNTKNDGSH